MSLGTDLIRELRRPPSLTTCFRDVYRPFRRYSYAFYRDLERVNSVADLNAILARCGLPEVPETATAAEIAERLDVDGFRQYSESCANWYAVTGGLILALMGGALVLSRPLPGWLLIVIGGLVAVWFAGLRRMLTASATRQHSRG